MNQVINKPNVIPINEGKARLQVAKYWQEIFKAPLNIKGDDKLLDNVQTLIDIYSLDQIRQVFIKAKNIFADDKWQIKNLTPSYILEPKHFADILGRYTPNNHVDIDSGHGMPEYTEKIKEIPRTYLLSIVEHYSTYSTDEDLNNKPDKDLRNIVYKYCPYMYQDKDGDYAVLGLGVYK
ncbi:protein of unknown function [Oenococcus oeni]|uniref:hypothetical protein n=1 Tax=Oenococcus oeni TaxID=1247 RepID=UPI00107C01AA|nr:hypothetical protein [Oenococcus oeni]AVI94084.1 hypothetical protein AX764_04220 [Oenococcus oeni]SYV99722.1 hypothetical protein OENI_20105 [Oenococcus oeni]SYW03902.1 hypothetical protein OENI_90043 [Oenococcus oeni]SYW17676.1 hypothetical protein OENI_10344 [Oenococcus oeni]VDC14599.1 protein of unknown function [Oenococcus oeni]